MEGIIVFLIIGIIVAGIAAYFLFVNYKKYKLILRTETSTISMVYDGFHEVKGRIVPLENQLVSPFAGKNCVYYHFMVEQNQRSGKSSKWVKIINDIRSSKFAIDDGTGKAVLDMSGADVQIKLDTKASSGFLNSADERERSVLEKYNQSNKMWIFEKTLRYTERYLEEGDELYVLGEVNGKEDRNPLFRKSAMPLYVSDKSEKELLGYYRTRMIISGIVIAGIAAFIVWVYSLSV